MTRKKLSEDDKCSHPSCELLGDYILVSGPLKAYCKKHVVSYSRARDKEIRQKKQEKKNGIVEKGSSSNV